MRCSYQRLAQIGLSCYLLDAHYMRGTNPDYRYRSTVILPTQITMKPYYIAGTMVLVPADAFVIIL